MLIILVDMFVSARPFPMANHWIGQAYSYGCSYMTVIGICIIGGNDIQVNCHYMPTPLSKFYYLLLLPRFLQSCFIILIVCLHHLKKKICTLFIILLCGNVKKSAHFQAFMALSSESPEDMDENQGQIGKTVVVCISISICTLLWHLLLYALVQLRQKLWEQQYAQILPNPYIKITRSHSVCHLRYSPFDES